MDVQTAKKKLATALGQARAVDPEGPLAREVEVLLDGFDWSPAGPTSEVGAKYADRIERACAECADPVGWDADAPDDDEAEATEPSAEGEGEGEQA